RRDHERQFHLEQIPLGDEHMKIVREAACVAQIGAPQGRLRTMRLATYTWRGFRREELSAEPLPLHMAIVVPQNEHRLIQTIMLIAEDAQCRRLQKKPPRLNGWKGKPSCGQHAQEVAVREDCDRTAGLAQTIHDSIRPREDLRERFSTRAAVTKEIPAWP